MPAPLTIDFRNEGSAVRVAPLVIVGAVGLAFLGCTSSGKKATTQPNPQPYASTDTRTVPPSPPAPAPYSNPVAPASMTGLLAGQVIDDTNSHLPAIYVQVVEPGVRSGASIEVPADAQGYFTIQGLQLGHTYQLIARGRLGDRVLAGSVVAMPPNPRVLIRLMPDVSMPGAYAGGNLQPDPRVVVQPPSSGPPAGAYGAGPAPRPAELGAPIGISPTAPPYSGPQGFSDQPRPRADIRPEDIAAGQALARADVPTQIPGPGDLPTPPPHNDTANVPARVPSCNLTGQTLYNFALNDLNGQPWEFRQRHGRLVLLDFWGTWCYYCQQAIPHLKDMQLRYGPYGLEVIGIAYEKGSVPEQVQKVLRVSNRLGINYRLLLGSDEVTCPVRTQFQIRSWPTFVLLDDQGRIIWRGEGMDAASMRTLEVIIRQRLGLR
jgi:thiol-disulfide isomerase/thioredoxin